MAKKQEERIEKRGMMKREREMLSSNLKVS